MRIIVSGATGAIGTALINECIANNIEILVITRERSIRNCAIPSHSLVRVCFCELEDFCSLQNDTETSYDVFYHFAWMGTSGPDRDDMHIQNLNVKYALDAVGLANRFGCHTFVGAGSQAEYGRVEGLLKPDTPTSPETGYGFAKLCAGQMTRAYASQLGLKHIWVRILSVYGPNDGNQSMIMSAILKLKRCEIPQFTKGEQMWDYLYSGDAAKAFRLIGEKGINNKIYVLGSGNARPLHEYIHEIKQVINPNIEVQIGALPYSEKQVMYLCADISELQKDTGYIPTAVFRDEVRKMGEQL